VVAGGSSLWRLSRACHYLLTLMLDQPSWRGCVNISCCESFVLCLFDTQSNETLKARSKEPLSRKE
jgi:hypothetical protein